MKTTLLTACLLLLAINLGTAQNPNLCNENLAFTREAFATHHWKVCGLIQAVKVQFMLDTYPEARRIITEDLTFVQRKGKGWRLSQDWGKTGEPVDAHMTDQLNTLCSVAEAPLKKPMTNDPSQGDFVWKPIREGKVDIADTFTFVRTREHPNPNGNYPTFTFIKYGVDPDGKLLLKEFAGPMQLFGAFGPVTMSYDMFLEVKGTTSIIKKPKK